MGRTLTVDNEPQDYFQQIFWAGVITVAHLPSTVFPTGPSKEGLPIGLQAVGAEFHDYHTINFARQLADEIGGFVPPPGFDASGSVSNNPRLLSDTRASRGQHKGLHCQVIETEHEAHAG